MLRPLFCLCALLVGTAPAGALAEEHPGPADPALAASCRREAGALLRETRLDFTRPAYSLRDGVPTVRIGLRLRDQPRDADDRIEASCARDPATGTVSATVVDAAADGMGPRVIVIRGPEEPMRPRAEAPAAHNPVSLDGGMVLWRLYPQSPRIGPPALANRAHRHRLVGPPVRPQAQTPHSILGPLPGRSTDPYIDRPHDRGVPR